MAKKEIDTSHLNAQQFREHRFNIILKFRQAGITELISLYCLWLTMYHPNKKVNIISIKDSVAKKVLKKIKYMYKNLPEHLKVPIINGRMGELGTASMIEFINGSFIESIPTSEEAGRSESLSLLVIDEAAIVDGLLRFGQQRPLQFPLAGVLS